MPQPELITPLNLRWTGTGANFTSGSQLVAFDHTVHQDGPSASLLREFLACEQLSLCWIVIGERQVIGPNLRGAYYGRLNLARAYTPSAQVISGFPNCWLERNSRHGQLEDGLLQTLRTG